MEQVAMRIRICLVVPCFAALTAGAEPPYTLTILPEWLQAGAINNAGQMTGVMPVPGGSRAFLFTNGDVRDLGALGGDFSCGIGINDSQQILGYACRTSDVCRPVRLDPITPPAVPEPGALAMLLAGVIMRVGANTAQKKTGPEALSDQSLRGDI
jgi:probable HAF family extracellular repeat protein